MARRPSSTNRRFPAAALIAAAAIAPARADIPPPSRPTDQRGALSADLALPRSPADTAPGITPGTTPERFTPLPEFDPSARFTAEIVPMLWVPAVGGDAAIVGGTGVDVETVDLDENEPTPAGRATIRADRFSLTFDAFAFERSADAAPAGGFTAGGVAFPAGSPIDADLGISAFELTAGWAPEWLVIVDPADAEPGDAFTDTAVWIELVGGARFYDVDLSLDAPGAGAASVNADWAEAVAGLRLHLDLPEGFGLTVENEFGLLPGGGESSFSWDISAAFDWSPSEHLGVRVGFRHLSFDYSDETAAGDTDLDLFLAGLFAAVTVRF